MKRAVCLFWAAVLLGVSATAQATLIDGLVAYWPFSGNASDATGNGHDGTVHGAILATDRFGTPNSAYDFAGGAYIEVAPDSQLQLTGPMTVNAWVNYRALPLNPRVISFGPDRRGYELWVGGGAFGTTPGQPVAFYGNGSVAAGTTLTANEWHMLTVVGTPGPGGKLELWVDAALAGSVSGGPTAFSYPGPLNIGRKAAPSYDAWTGLIDDIMIYQRALSGSEIQALYTLNATLPPPPRPAVVPGSALLAGAGLLGFAGACRLRRG